MQNTKVGRNDPCPCGSDKKYKKCCGKPDPEKTRTDLATEAMTNCVEELRTIWIKGYKEIVQRKDQLSLAAHIEMFGDSMRDSLGQRYPFIVNSGVEFYWMVILSAILAAKTCPEEDVQQAQRVIHERHLGDAGKANFSFVKKED